MTIDQIKSAADTNVRQKTVANSVTRDEVADLFDNLADEQRDRGMYGVDTTAGLAAVSGANYRKVAVGDTGIFEWASTGTANGTTIFAASGGGVWILKMAIPKGALASLNSIDYTTNLITNKPDLTLKADLVGGKVPSAQLPSYVDDVEEYANLAAFPVTGEAGKIYITLDNNSTYRWSGSQYVLLVSGGGGGGGETLEQTLALGNNMPPTNQAGDTGVIRKRGVIWMHDFTPSGGSVDTTIVGVNTYLGYMAGSLNNSNTTGAEGGRNIAIGYYAGSSNTTGWQNVAIGHLANKNVTTGKYNTAIGTWTLIDNIVGDNNTAVGSDALWKNLSSDNTAVGTYSLQLNETGINNVALGVHSQRYGISGSQNNSIGNSSLSNNTGLNNNAFGYEALRFNTSGSNNLAIGTQSLYTNTTGANNVGIGSYSLYFLDGGVNNVAIGYVAGGDITTGYNNTLIGYQSGQILSTGKENILLGSNAGDLITTGSNNIVIGYNINPISTTGNNQLNIGDLIHGDLSNQSINIGTNTIDASAILSASSTTKGFLPPRMTSTQATAISSPAEGLLVYVTDTNGTFTTKGWWGYNGAAWQQL